MAKPPEPIIIQNPPGGSYARVIFSKRDGTPCEKDEADLFEAITYDDQDRVVKRTSGERKRLD